MLIAIPLFEGITALDAVGPYAVLSRLPGAQVRFVAPEPGPVRNHPGSLGLVADDALDEVPECAVFEDSRVVEDGKDVTAAGVSSGIDMALTLAARLTDETVAQPCS